ncbi:universal stress protein [Salinibacter grassmerensis]|uniref:universal stress protein n=1 Tax=Salinibacter grassmerensis TaxID=3040353 RepID=UPI0021E86255|nr:universal stress protein [Salinibacter grassmerensis]
MLAIDDLLVARDFSSVSDRAVRYALDVAARTGATLHVLHADVLHEAPDPDADEGRSPGDGFSRFRDAVKQEGTVSADALDAVTIKEVVRRDVSAGPAIVNYATEADVDLIALGTHGRRGPSRILLGSVAEEVVRRSDQPVLSVRGDADGQSESSPRIVDRILVPVDFSDPSRETLRTAKEWAALYDASIDVLHVVAKRIQPAFYTGGVQSIYDMEPDIEQKMMDRLETFVADTGGPERTIRPHVVVGNAAPDIAEFVDTESVDLVAMSTHGRTGLDRFLLGSVAEKVVRYVHCPVLTMKPFGTTFTTPEEKSESSA